MIEVSAFTAESVGILELKGELFMSWTIAHYHGSLNMPRIEFEQEERIYVQVDGRLIPISDEGVAARNIAFYAREGKEATIVKRVESIGYEVPW